MNLKKYILVPLMALIALISLSGGVATIEVSANSEELDFQEPVVSKNRMSGDICDKKLNESITLDDTVARYVTILKSSFVLPSTKYILYATNRYQLIKFMVYCNDTLGIKFPENIELFARCIEVQTQLNFHTLEALNISRNGGPYKCYTNMPCKLTYFPMRETDIRDILSDDGTYVDPNYKENSGNGDILGVCVPVVDPVDVLTLSSVDEKHELDIYPHPCFDIKVGGNGKSDTGITVVNNCMSGYNTNVRSVPCSYKVLTDKLNDYYNEVRYDDMVHNDGVTDIPLYWDPIISRVM